MFLLTRETKVNPLAQVAGLLILLIPVFISYDPMTPVVALIICTPFLIFCLGPDLKAWRFLILPILFFSFTLLLMNLFFSMPQAHEIVYWHWGPCSLTSFSVFRACSIFTRCLVLSVFTTLTATAFGPLDLVRACMQQLKMSPLWGYSLYAGLNVLPLIVQDLVTMNQTRKVRLQGRRESWSQKLTLPVNLLASAVRRAERISLSMAARDLEKAKNRTFVVVSSWRKRDVFFMILCCALSLVVLIISWKFHLFTFNLG